MLANVEGAPLLLNGLLMEHPFVSRSDLLDRVLKHYVSAAIRVSLLYTEGVLLVVTYHLAVIYRNSTKYLAVLIS